MLLVTPCSLTKFFMNNFAKLGAALIDLTGISVHFWSVYQQWHKCFCFPYSSYESHLKIDRYTHSHICTSKGWSSPVAFDAWLLFIGNSYIASTYKPTSLFIPSLKKPLFLSWYIFVPSRWMENFDRWHSLRTSFLRLSMFGTHTTVASFLTILFGQVKNVSNHQSQFLLLISLSDQLILDHPFALLQFFRLIPVNLLDKKSLRYPDWNWPSKPMPLNHFILITSLKTHFDVFY